MKSIDWQKGNSDEFKDSLILFLAIACILLFSALIYVLVSDVDSMNSKVRSNEKSNLDSTDFNNGSNNLIATINQEAIYASDVISIFNTYSQELRTEEGLKQAIDQAISNKLLIQEAKKIGLSVSQAEMDDATKAFMLTNKLTRDALEQNLKNSNFTISDFEKSIEENLILKKIIEEITKDVVSPSDDEVKDFFDRYSSNLTILGRSATRQIFLFANQSNAEDKLEEINLIAAKLNSTNFCEVVEDYSEDLTTKETCGLYDVLQGQLLSEYEKAVYESKPGDVKLVGTRMGYHIILVENVTQPRLANFEESKEQLNQYMLLTKKQAVLIEFINKLRQDAQIVDYTTKQN